MRTAMSRAPAEPKAAVPTISMTRGQGARIDRKCATCADEERDRIQRAVDPSRGHRVEQIAVTAPAVAAAEPLEVSEPSDPSEREAEHVADQVMRALWSGAAPAEAPALWAARPAVQRAVDGDAEAQPAEMGGGFLVEDETASLLAGQMRKSDFLDALRPAVCAAADRELARAGRNTDGCPYLDRWFGYYAERDARQVERSLRRYAPGTAAATSARDYIQPVAERVARGVRSWVTTGEVPELPEGVSPDMLGGGGVGEALAGVGSAIGGAIMSGLSAIGSFFSGLFFKGAEGGAAQGADRGAVAARMGEGRPLDGAAQARMGSAFGADFGAVRVHTDAPAGAAAEGLNARAFTLGTHIAFAPGQYRPGTLVGDALLAHELAHVVQQGAATSEREPSPSSEAIEHDADAATADAMQSLWAGGQLQEQPQRGAGGPRVRSGLSLARCARQAPQVRPPDRPVVPEQPAQPQRTRLEQCGVVVPGMPIDERDHIIDCRRHENFVEAMRQSVAGMRTVSGPYAPGLAALYDALLTQVEASPVTDPAPTRSRARIFKVTNVSMRVSSSTSLTVPMFSLKLQANGTGAENGAYSGNPTPELMLNEESGSAVLFGANQDRQSAQRDIERTMYHEGVHFLSELVTKANRFASHGTPPVQPELDASLVNAYQQPFKAAVLPYWSRALHEPSAIDPSTDVAPTAARIGVLADGYATLMWEKVANEVITRVEEQVYLAAREGRTFTSSDVLTLPQPWLETAQYWPSFSLEQAAMQTFLNAESAGIRRDVLPVVQQIQRDFLAQRPQQ